jgi:hypothetical protein
MAAAIAAVAIDEISLEVITGGFVGAVEPTAGNNCI